LKEKKYSLSLIITLMIVSGMKASISRINPYIEKEKEYNYLKAESKFLKWAMKEGCPRMILRDYDVRYSMKNWRYDYQ